MTAINNLPGLAKFNNATHEVDGLMSRNDKQKLDGLHKSVTIHTVLYASEWSKNRPYIQTLELPDITYDTNGSLTIDPIATKEEIEACENANIIIAEQSFKYMTLQVTEEKPKVDIPIVIVYGENLAVITPPTVVDTGNHVHDVIVQSTDWVRYLDTYKTSLYIPGITESVVGSVSMKSGINEDEAFVAAKARIEIFKVLDNTVELILRGEKPNIPLHLTVYYGPSIAIVRRPVFGGKITPHAKYQEYDDSKTGLGVTKTQSALEELITGTTGLNNKATHFKTIAVMKEAMDLKVGQLVTTSGYRTENDGGGATYLITSNSSKQDNGGSVHVLKNGLRAEIVLSLGEDINLKCFGLYGDAIHDDTPAFKRGFDLCKQIKGGTVRWQGVAAINEPLIVDSHYINIKGYGYGSTIKANFKKDYVLSVTYEEYSTTEEIQQIYIGDFRINGNHLAKHGMIIDDNLPIYNSIFENIYIYDTEDIGFIADNCKNCKFDLIIIDNCHGGIKLINGVHNIKFNNCIVTNNNINEALLIKEGDKDDPSDVEFNYCKFGHSESKLLMKIDSSFNVYFNRCIFDLYETLCEDYSILLNAHAKYTRFIDCFFDGANKTCGMIKTYGPETSIVNLNAIDIKSEIHILVYDHIHINGIKLLGDSTPLRVYTPNDNKYIIDMSALINVIEEDDIVFPSNAIFYNMYMNQRDELGIKGKLNNYILDKHLEIDNVEKLYTIHDIDKFDYKLTLPAQGVWEVNLFLDIDDGNQGKICKYQVTFKQNSVYSIANIQDLITPIEWGNNIKIKTPVIDKYGNLTLSFIDTSNTNRSSWNLKLSCNRIMNFEY